MIEIVAYAVSVAARRFGTSFGVACAIWAILTVEKVLGAWIWSVMP